MINENTVRPSAAPIAQYHQHVSNVVHQVHVTVNEHRRMQFDEYRCSMTPWYNDIY